MSTRRFNLCLDKVEQGNKVLIEDLPDEGKDVVDAFLQDVIQDTCNPPGVLHDYCANEWGPCIEQLSPDDVRNLLDETEEDERSGTESIYHLSTTGDSSPWSDQ